jgi:hypothetical protein
MINAVVEHSGLFLAECGCCHGNFVYAVVGYPAQEVGLTTNARAKAFLVGQCPLCDAPIKSLVSPS